MWQPLPPTAVRGQPHVLLPMVGVTTQSHLKQLPEGGPPPPGGNADESEANIKMPNNKNSDCRIPFIMWDHGSV